MINSDTLRKFANKGKPFVIYLPMEDRSQFRMANILLSVRMGGNSSFGNPTEVLKSSAVLW